MSKARKLDDCTTSAKHRTVSKSFSHALLKARGEKKMTQIDLAKATNQPLVVIKHYESGKAIPNGQVINKLNRVLGVCLPSAK
jgi:putative transcription factor